MWGAVESDPESGLPLSFQVNSDRCCSELPEDYINCWTEYIGNLPSIQPCFNICNEAYETCLGLCGEDADCIQNCEDIRTTCLDTCISDYVIPSQGCCNIGYAATFTVIPPEGDPIYIACGDGGVVYQEFIGLFEDNLGNSQECTIYFYDLPC